MTSHIPMDVVSSRENVPEVVLFSKPAILKGDSNKAAVHRTRNALGDIGNRAMKKEGSKTLGSKDINMKASHQLGATKPQGELKGPRINQNKTASSALLASIACQQREIAKLPSNLHKGSKTQQDQLRKDDAKKTEPAAKVQRKGILKHSHVVDQEDKTCSELPTVAELQVESMVNAFSEQRLNELPEDIDAKDGSNFILVTEYILEIMKYMFALEKNFPIHSNFLDGRSINSRMRAVLMDWLVEVHNQYNFCAETLYLCNKIMDRFLSVDKEISRSDLQLVGVTALFLASKYEEVYVPSIRDFAVISDNAFTVTHIRNMESRILQALRFDLSCPQPCFFLRRFSKAAHADVKLHSLAKYIMELSVVDYTVVELMPSAIAAASLALALLILNRDSSLYKLWNRTLEYYSSYTVASIRPLALKMANVLAHAHEDQSKLKAVKQKYAKGKSFFRISRLEELSLENWKHRIFLELQD